MNFGPIRNIAQHAWKTMLSLAAKVLTGLHEAGSHIIAICMLVLAWMRGIWRYLWRGAAMVGKAAVILVLIIAGIQIFVVTGRDVAYRYRTPDQPHCGNVPAKVKQALAGSAQNNELAAIDGDKSGVLKTYLTCMLQKHEIPVDANAHYRTGQQMGPIRYNLAFLEFTQDGRPPELSSEKEPLQENPSQLDAILNFLSDNRESEHYVIAFIHGWRHDARIGDGNVAALRTYAAYVASFLDYRCKTAIRNCGAAVTGVYIGWRGARIDERTWVGKLFGTSIGTVLAAPTLFDRKPVSERIAPAVVAALREIGRKLDELGTDRNATAMSKNKMITIGHSLGGNMLAVALRETMIDRVHRHHPDALMKPPFGDLIVLINPASEAMNWTSIQQAMRTHVMFERSGEETSQSEFEDQVLAGHRFFRREQPPIYISITSAYAWPVGGIRLADWNSQNTAKAREKMRQYRAYAGYDWATHDVFPLFKGDLRPLAETLERQAEIQRNQVCDEDICKEQKQQQFKCIQSPWECTLRILAAAARNFPFMDTNNEETRTIGHFEPMRPPYGTIAQRRAAASFYGTTHELVVNEFRDIETKYEDAAVPQQSECAIVEHWLWKARARVGNDYGWDSGYSYGGTEKDKEGDPKNLTPIRPRLSTETPHHLESQFIHGYNDGGIFPIVRGNDPFWNMRAYHTALKEHDGFVFYPLICAINQLVMDAVASPDGQ
jgi:hypothetical protein